MALTKRAEVLMEPEDYGRLEEIARRRNTTVEELIRRAVRSCYLSDSEKVQKGIDDILSLQVPIVFSEDWEKVEGEIMEAHHRRLS